MENWKVVFCKLNDMALATPQVRSMHVEESTACSWSPTAKTAVLKPTSSGIWADERHTFKGEDILTAVYEWNEEKQLDSDAAGFTLPIPERQLRQHLNF